MDIKLALDRIDFNEKRIHEVIADLIELRKEIITKTPDDKTTYLKLLGSEKFRMENAKQLGGSDKETIKLLGMTKRTFYRKKKLYNLGKNGN